MDYYFKNLKKIDQNFPDLSEYDNFFTQMNFFISKELRNITENEAIKILVECINEIENSHILAYCYKSLYNLEKDVKKFTDLNIKPNKKSIEKHINYSYELKKSVYMYSSNHEDLYVFLKGQIVDDLFSDSSLLHTFPIPLFTGAHELVNEFLSIRDVKFIKKQFLMMIENRYLPKNLNTIEYFISLIGSHDKYICHIASEWLYFMRNNLIEISFLEIKTSDGIKMWGFRKPLVVKSPKNFVIFIINHLPNREELLNALKTLNNIQVNHILQSLIITQELIALNSSEIKKIESDLHYNVSCVEDSCFNNGNTLEFSNFDHLFFSDHFKAKMDCIEI
ncbi:hypothetical protein EDEG_00779 [Edhazardia aedis USNM 41457]|uniref:Uncharacterized protein n=1 Tax=Edhazardia aedis (strain USNM 41457) TaxID=1003232 RepID=J9DV25_EDHAE|nr:hypothetical protein EDEG_00779 [Edhazardia aedis USNM 41457]|eukprot:EJW05132.1 hypothetical protein EDEG_00779 [Edhazardia aedis USNM 41457]